MTSKNRFIRTRAMLFAVALSLPALALAGPPLICHPYEIGSAKSLPGGNWGHGISSSYDRKNLVNETLELLTPTTPVLARMETLRRAALYATANMHGWEKNDYTAEERKMAGAILENLRERSKNAPDSTRSLALFDLGFYAETLRQTGIDPALDGYALLVKAAELRGGDAEMEFALAVAANRPAIRSQQAEHLAKARAAAAQNPLLASNLASHFGKT
jgi:hypothetical protein